MSKGKENLGWPYIFQDPHQQQNPIASLFIDKVEKEMNQWMGDQLEQEIGNRIG